MAFKNGKCFEGCSSGRDAIKQDYKHIEGCWAKSIDPRNEIVVAYYDEENGKGKVHYKNKLQIKPKDKEGYELTLMWLD